MRERSATASTVPAYILPAELTSFVGRTRELAEARSLLRNARLLTLVGTAGCGKTRLALRLAATIAGEFSDGVCLVELAGVSSPALVEETTAMALGVRPESGQTATAALLGAVATGKLLLLLDNCEHVAKAVARMTESLLRGGTSLSVLATSREPLRVDGEVVLRVQPLECPAITRELPVGDLAHIESVALFLDRARSHLSSFVLTPENAQPVAEICRRLDGIPLAIELAAARLAALGVEQLVARLDNAIRLLGGGRCTIQRQETLRATLDWSYALLDFTEHQVLKRLSLFAGGFELRAAEVVCAGQDLDSSQATTVIADLVEKSLISVMASDGATRYRMLEMVRQYAFEYLERDGDADSARQRHALHILDLAEEAEPGLKGPEATIWLNRLEREHDNLRAALSRFERSNQTEPALRLAAALHQYLVVRGYHREGRERLAKVLALPASARATAARAKVLMALGELTIEEADYQAAGADLDEARSIFETLCDSSGLAYALWYLGRVHRRGADNAGSRPLFEQSIELFRRVGDKRGLAGALMTLGDCLANLDETARARPILEESLLLFREVGGVGALASVSWVFGNLACAEGRYDEARAHFSEALKTGSRLADRR